MTTHGDETLDRDLHRLVVKTVNGRREADLVARCLELAVVTRADDRAWALVRLAADLRALGESKRALTVLDTAWELEPSDTAVRAIATCAIACHCDLRTYDKAELIEVQPSALPPDLKRARAAVRLYTELFEQTGSPEYRIRREFFSMLIAELELPETRAGIAS